MVVALAHRQCLQEGRGVHQVLVLVAYIDISGYLRVSEENVVMTSIPQAYPKASSKVCFTIDFEFFCHVAF
jgi:hypothetical protein